METDAALVTRAKNGDESAFGEIVRRHLPAVFAFAVRYAGDEALAEDVAQEAFVRAWRHLSRFDEARALRPWLFQIARNAARDALRKKRATPFSRMFGRQESEDDTAFEETVADDAPLPPELFERKELARLLDAALKELPERDRALLLMRYEDGAPFDDIAGALGAPVNTVKSWHRRALLRLKEPLSKYAPD